ncbi:cobalt ECF transporter T component CbiQ [Capilliphycus salinus ALCB114379]|uniref:cobalt ECF transporter T component CbiQ n=1 Tax=Capilliphycus salinus TaxID=2768948 RepID=UPI0039A546FE
MRFALDEYANLNSPIHRWHPQYKLIGLFALMFAYAMVEDLRLLPVILTLTAILYLLSRLPLSFLLTRLRYPGIFLIGIVAVLPFFSGQTILWEWGIITLRQEGLLAVVLIVCRFLAIFITGLVLFGSGSFLNLIKAMRSLGLSPILADMMLLSYRYLFELGYQLNTMQRATRLRGFKPTQLSWRNLQVYAALAGSLLVRSYQQSQEIYKAMQLRGYGTSIKSINSKPSLDVYSLTALIITLAIVAGLIGLEFFLF